MRWVFPTLVSVCQSVCRQHLFRKLLVDFHKFGEDWLKTLLLLAVDYSSKLSAI